jgi:hypothetical protein
MPSPAIRLPPSNQSRGREQDALRTTRNLGGSRRGMARRAPSEKAGIPRTRIAASQPTLATFRCHRGHTAAKLHETTERAAQAAMRRRKQGARRSRLLTRGKHGYSGACVHASAAVLQPRPQKHLTLPKPRGGARCIEARARLLRSAGGAPWRDVEARAANGDQGRD